MCNEFSHKKEDNLKKLPSLKMTHQPNVNITREFLIITFMQFNLSVYHIEFEHKRDHDVVYIFFRNKIDFEGLCKLIERHPSRFDRFESYDKIEENKKEEINKKLKDLKNRNFDKRNQKKEKIAEKKLNLKKKIQKKKKQSKNN